MDQLEKYFLSKVQIPDIVYIGIGSACIRDSNPENMQQFPPWLESEYNNSNKTFCIINIDPRFESPYLLTQRLPVELDESISNDLFKLFVTDRLECIYVNEQFKYVKWDDEKKAETIDCIGINPLDIINQLVMNSSKLLISGNYTGVSNDLLEKYFFELYVDIPIYSTNITYNFMNDNHGSCMVNLLENFPLIDYSLNQLVKIENIIQITHLDYLTIKNIYGNNIFGLDNKIIHFSLNKLKSLLHLELFLYRNYLHRSYGEHMIWALKKSSFCDLDICDYVNFDSISLKMRELIYENYIEYLLLLSNIENKTNETNDEIIQTIEYLQSIPSDPNQIYVWTNNFSKSLRKLDQIYLE